MNHVLEAFEISITKELREVIRPQLWFKRLCNLCTKGLKWKRNLLPAHHVSFGNHKMNSSLTARPDTLGRHLLDPLRPRELLPMCPRPFYRPLPGSPAFYHHDTQENSTEKNADPVFII